MSRFRYPQPPNEDAFEEFCLILGKEAWSKPFLERYGHRGERQHGIDLLDMSGDTPLFAVQCKHHASNRTLPPKEIEDEIAKVLTFEDPVGTYFVLTTAKKGTRAQNKVRKINDEHRVRGRNLQVRLLTWDDIERLIDASPAARQFLGLEADDGTVRALKAQIGPLGDMLRAQIGEGRHGDLDEAKAHLDKGEPHIALALLQRLRRRAWTELTPGQRSRCCTLQADAQERVGETNAAAALLLEALRYTPEEEHAITNAITARRLLGEEDTARELAETARRRFPTSAAAYGACLELASAPDVAEGLARSVPTVLSTAPDVLAAIAGRPDIGDLAEQAARTLVKQSAEDPRSWFCLGSRLLDVEMRKIIQPNPDAPEHPDPARLREARDAFAKAGELAAKSGHIGVRVATLLRSMTAAELLHDSKAIRCDADAALELAPSNPDVLLAVARAAEERGDLEAAVNFLRKAAMRNTGADEIDFFLGVALWNKSGPGDRTEAANYLAKAARGGGPHSEPAADLAIESLLTTDGPDAATTLLRDVASALDPVLADCLRSRIAAASNDDEEARKCAESALQNVAAQTSDISLKKLAKVLISLGRHRDALPLFRRVARPLADDEAGRRLVECAARMEEYGIVLDYCRRARAAGVYDDYLLEWELQLLDRYAPEAAVALLEEMLRRDPNDHGARVHLIGLAVRLRHDEKAREHAAQLPAVTDVEAEEGATVVAILQHFGRHKEAVSFAYDLLRRYFGDARAHRAFRNALLEADRDKDEPQVVDVVAPGVAVRVSEQGHADQWTVLEDSVIPATGVENEVRADSETAKLLLGKRVGETVVISDGPGLKRSATVTEIVPKYTFRVRDIWERWQFRFPQHQEMWMVSLGTDPEKPDFAQFFEMIEHRKARSEEAEEIYRTKIVPLVLLHKVLGDNEIEILGHIARREGLRLRCCAGTAEEYETAVAAFRSAPDVVLELSGIGTLLMLEQLERLQEVGKRLILSRSTSLVIRALLADAERAARAMSSRTSSPTDEANAARVDFFRRALRFCEEQCVIMDAPEQAYLNPELRKELEILGTPGLETAVLASQPNRTLWSDDGVYALIARERLGVRRIWTQACLAALVDEGRIAGEVHESASARLIGWGYSFTRSNPVIMREAGRLAKWNRDQWPLNEAVKYLGLQEVRPEDAVFLGVSLVKDGYREVAIQDQRRGLLLDVLAALRQRPDMSESLLNDFDRFLPKLFGLDALGADDARKTFRAWRAGGPKVVLRP